MARKKNKKVVKYRKPIRLNIGIIIFSIILVYVVYYSYIYFTRPHVSLYVVEQGTIALDNRFTGLILREEKIISAKEAGYIRYFLKDETKAGKGDYVYSMDQNDNFYETITDNTGQLNLSDDSYLQLENTADQFISSYSDQQYYQTYQFKYDMEAALTEASVFTMEENKETIANNSMQIYAAEYPGIVTYYTDGFEGTTIDNFTKDMFRPEAYKKNNFIQATQVKLGDPVYKLITNETWDVVIPIDEELKEKFAEKENMSVIFKKDNSRITGASQILTKGNVFYLVLTFQNSMIRFASDRYAEVELTMTETSGLKIPNTAITSKEYFILPKKYIQKKGSQNGIYRKVLSEDGKLISKFIPITVVHEGEDEYFIEGEGLVEDILVEGANSNDSYKLDSKKSLQGVYNINRGYAIFRRIDLLFQNEAYAIVSKDTTMGVSLYDHIALDSSIVKENAILY
jgi:hypothetical protein